MAGVEKDSEKLVQTQSPGIIRRRKLVALTSIILGGLLCLGSSNRPVYLGHRHPDTSLHWVAQYVRAKGLDAQSIEQIFLSVPDESSAIATSQQYTSTPHMAGTDNDLRTAKDLLTLIQSELGISTGAEHVFDAGTQASRQATTGIRNLTGPYAWIDTYYPLLNKPTGLSTLEILNADGQTVWRANLTERVPEHDASPIEYKYANAIPPFHGYSRNGTGQGEVIYANYGRKEDFEELVSKGVNITGRVVMARYGSIFRGLKVKFAQEHGAVAVLLFDDPETDGAITVVNGYKPYPAGPARNPTSLQRGSVQFLSMYPGDPTTPGYPSYPNSTRAAGENIPKIPSLPISWENAQQILKAGEEKLTIKIVNSVDTKISPIWNTMAVIPGHIKNEVVVLGNHRDAWVMGAADPTSGTVSMVEVIRGYGALLRRGWKPLRTIMFASWDAEEFGLVGSTEYGEDFAGWIKEHVVAYINLDVSVSGSRFEIQASPSLADLAREVASTIPHPTDANRTLWDMRRDSGPFSGPIAPGAQKLFDSIHNTGSGTEVGALGSGSDYTVFLQHLGIASVDQGIGHGINDAAYHYHSVYDSHHWMNTYGDRGFHKHVALARHLGILGLRIVDSIVLPINTTRYTVELFDYIERIESRASDESIKVNTKCLRKTVGRLLKASRRLDREKFEAEKRLVHLIERWQHRKEEDASSPTQYKRGILRFRLGKAAAKLHTRSTDQALPPHGERRKLLRKMIKAAQRVHRINNKLAAFEAGFISSDGIKDREWYKHLGTAPGKNLGYGATTLPAIAEAISEDKNSTLAQLEINRLQHLLQKLSQQLRE